MILEEKTKARVHLNMDCIWDGYLKDYLSPIFETTWYLHCISAPL